MRTIEFDEDDVRTDLISLIDKNTNKYYGNTYLSEAVDDILKYVKQIINPKQKTVVFKDGTYLYVADGVTWEYENDENWLLTI